MQVERFAIEGPLLLTPRMFSDQGGYFFESWKQRRLAVARGMRRGLQDQLEPEPQGKLVRCVVGEIYDVAVDLRRSSSTESQWLGDGLSGTKRKNLWDLLGYAHCFLTLSKTADVFSKASGFWSKDCKRSLRWEDPNIGIVWPPESFGGSERMLVSQDAEAPTLAEARSVEEVFA